MASLPQNLYPLPQHQQASVEWQEKKKEEDDSTPMDTTQQQLLLLEAELNIMILSKSI